MPMNEPDPSTLVVMLHAFTSRPSHLDGVQAAVRLVWPTAQFMVPTLPLSLLSMVRLDEVVSVVLREIDAAVADAQQAGRPIARIVLVGHSMGALLARKVYVAACGEIADAPFEAALATSGPQTDNGMLAPRDWALRVSRIVLLAGMNRGWRITHHLGLTNALLWTAGSLMEQLVRPFGRSFTIFSIRKGASFITNLRVQWLRLRQAHASGQSAAGGAITVQLLGSRDDMVAPEDNVDLVSGGDFHYLDVPYSGHSDVIEFDDPKHGEGRRQAFLLALTSTPAELQAAAVVPSDERFSQPDTSVRRVLFVIHGIRDVGYWTQKIARRVKQRAGAEGTLWATETSSYGYFPMLPFLFPWTRRQKVEWLMDQYTEALARFPQARFSYIGHSNGTYLLARALQLYPCCRFEHVTFAGSVVSRRYDWRPALQSRRGAPPQVHAVLNFTATNDWVVAWFPKFFQVLRLQDLGSAGHDGFVQAGQAPRVHQRGCVRGGHSAALDESLWDVIADFTLTGNPPPQPLPGTKPQPDRWVRWPGLFPPLVWLALLLLLVAGWWGMQTLAMALPLAGDLARGAARGAAAALYLLLLWLVVTRL